LSFDAGLAHGPLSGLDEYLVHNNPLPVRVMWTSDPRSYERVWFTCQDHVGELLVVCGLAFYPYLDTAEAFAIVTLRGQHTTVRAHRRLGVNRMDMTVGPVTLDVVRPFQEWRLRLGDNAHGISFDISWFDSKRPRYRNIGAQTVAGGRLFDGVAGYEGFGRQEGWVRVGDETFELGRETHAGTRDHHWGTRDGVGGPAYFSGHQHAISGLFVEFADWALWCDTTLPPLADVRARNDAVLSQTYRLRFEPDTRLLLGGESDVVLASGTQRHLTFERQGAQIAFLRCGMYGGPNGGTPGTDIWQGMYVGDDVVTGETYDVTKPEVRRQLAGADQMQCRVECDGEVASGLIEVYDTLVYDAAVAGRRGITLLE
jgi:hypothetical protein